MLSYYHRKVKTTKSNVWNTFYLQLHKEKQKYIMSRNKLYPLSIDMNIDFLISSDDKICLFDKKNSKVGIFYQNSGIQRIHQNATLLWFNFNHCYYVFKAGDHYISNQSHWSTYIDDKVDDNKLIIIKKVGKDVEVSILFVKFVYIYCDYNEDITFDWHVKENGNVVFIAINQTTNEMFITEEKSVTDNSLYIFENEVINVVSLKDNRNLLIKYNILLERQTITVGKKDVRIEGNKLMVDDCDVSHIMGYSKLHSLKLKSNGNLFFEAKESYLSQLCFYNKLTSNFPLLDRSKIIEAKMGTSAYGDGAVRQILTKIERELINGPFTTSDTRFLNVDPDHDFWKKDNSMDVFILIFCSQYDNVKPKLKYHLPPSFLHRFVRDKDYEYSYFHYMYDEKTYNNLRKNKIKKNAKFTFYGVEYDSVEDMIEQYYFTFNEKENALANLFYEKIIRKYEYKPNLINVDKIFTDANLLDVTGDDIVEIIVFKSPNFDNQSRRISDAISQMNNEQARKFLINATGSIDLPKSIFIDIVSSLSVNILISTCFHNITINHKLIDENTDEYLISLLADDSFYMNEQNIVV